jgi:hypothetical protein
MCKEILNIIAGGPLGMATRIIFQTLAQLSDSLLIIPLHVHYHHYITILII